MLVLDVRIVNGYVIDGTGADRQRADVSVRDGRVVAIGQCDEVATRTIDADGRLVTPGFVDVHSHLDAQLFWDPAATPSPLHGVTTAFAGNCGFTIAPLSADTAEYMMSMLSRVEGMPLESLRTGVDWRWSSTEEYLDRLDGHTAINAGFMVGHSAVRRLVMGEAANERTATAAEVDAMAQLVRAGIAAGAMGFSTTTAESHSDALGRPVPSRWAGRDEFVALARVCGEFPGTSLEMLPRGAASIAPFDDDVAELMIDMSVAAGRPLNWNVIQPTAKTLDMWLAKLAVGDRAQARGGKVVGLTMPIDMKARFSFHSGFVLDMFDGWSDIMALPVREKLACFRDPAQRAELQRSAEGTAAMRHLARWDDLVLVETFAEQNQAHRGRRVGDVAAELGKQPFDTLVDIAIADDLRTTFARNAPPPTDADWDARIQLCRDRRALIGASDAGRAPRHDRRVPLLDRAAPGGSARTWLADDGGGRPPPHGRRRSPLRTPRSGRAARRRCSRVLVLVRPPKLPPKLPPERDHRHDFTDVLSVPVHQVHRDLDLGLPVALDAVHDRLDHLAGDHRVGRHVFRGVGLVLNAARPLQARHRRELGVRAGDEGGGELADGEQRAGVQDPAVRGVRRLQRHAQHDLSRSRFFDRDLQRRDKGDGPDDLLDLISQRHDGPLAGGPSHDRPPIATRFIVNDADGRIDVKSLDRLALTRWFAEELDESPTRARRVYKQLWQAGAASFDAMEGVPEKVRKKLNAKAYVASLETDLVLRSKDGAIKFLWRLHDGHVVESVLIPDEDRLTLCMSSQVGCAMACTFCLTGDLGLKRHLTPSEIANQPLQVQKAIGDDRRITNLVLMGMGEPLHNLDNLLIALRNCLDDDGQNFSHRRVTVSTVGLVPKMAELAAALPVNLAVSLNATTEASRRAIMPITKRHSMKELLDACRDFPLPRTKRIAFEYVMFAGQNDAIEDADRLVELLHGIKAKVNLIPYNENPDRPNLKRPSEEVVRAFQDRLIANHLNCTVRTTRGIDISAACGQLGKGREQAASNGWAPADAVSL